ncbi:MAG: hypothetical protein LZF86_40102 [Nitrospira sp.]|nr:MAG: hypothetical protein LZF86_40102 [Nitrospira sp.]
MPRALIFNSMLRLTALRDLEQRVSTKFTATFASEGLCVQSYNLPIGSPQYRKSKILVSRLIYKHFTMFFTKLSPAETPARSLLGPRGKGSLWVVCRR